ncbi:hypothetical protein OsI_22702 [Oryza sativa Indica Group]|uniref:Uncharacterized protein n=1 Tax=Oryza sativa subsp. indica TaxID=39946 RepID=B8B128_ORYSI|nr:hypothetical protein OsI_22702 [Oryza sativa Indica Group]
MAVDKSGGGGGGGGASSSSSGVAASTMDRFHKIILSWDYVRLVADSKGGQQQAKGLGRVKNTYASVAEYLAVFEPLLFEEVKAQIVQGRSDEEEEAGQDWQKGIVASCTESEGFHKVSMAVLDDFREMVSENDLLLLSKEKFEEGVTPSAYAFALVEQRGGRETISLRTFVAGSSIRGEYKERNNTIQSVHIWQSIPNRHWARCNKEEEEAVLVVGMLVRSYLADSGKGKGVYIN